MRGVCAMFGVAKRYLRRCEEIGIEAALWKDRYQVGIRVVLVSVEQVKTAMYESYIRRIQCVDRLQGIFVNEAHLTVLWAEFLVSMKSIRDEIRPKGVKVSIRALIATFSPEAKEVIALACGMKN